MLFEQGHPLISENDWRQFSNQLSPYFKNVLDREKIELPHWFVPLARGVLIASPFLLRSLARKRRRPTGWTSLSLDTYQRAVGDTRLRVRRTRDGRFWAILRWPPRANLRSNKRAETLVHTFGSTPVLSTTRHQAQQLAELFEARDAFSSLRWVRVSPRWLIGALAIAVWRAESKGLKISWDYDWSSDARRVRSRSTYTGRQPVPVDIRFALQVARDAPTASSIYKEMIQ
jgi:hypothetical protein